jgi:hypothetical protein
MADTISQSVKVEEVRHYFYGLTFSTSTSGIANDECRLRLTD